METFKDNFTISDEVGDLYICTHWNNSAETAVKKVFLKAYHLALGDSFEAQYDRGGCILLETINVFDDSDYNGFLQI